MDEGAGNIIFYIIHPLEYLGKETVSRLIDDRLHHACIIIIQGHTIHPLASPDQPLTNAIPRPHHRLHPSFFSLWLLQLDPHPCRPPSFPGPLPTLPPILPLPTPHPLTRPISCPTPSSRTIPCELRPTRRQPALSTGSEACRSVDRTHSSPSVRHLFLTLFLPLSLSHTHTHMASPPPTQVEARDDLTTSLSKLTPFSSSAFQSPSLLDHRLVCPLLSTSQLVAPSAMAATCYALYGAMRSARAGNSVQLQKFFRYRVLFVTSLAHPSLIPLN